MVHWSVLIALIIGAAGLWLSLGRQERVFRVLGAILGVGAIAFLLALATRIGGETGGDRPPALFYVFSLIAVGCAGRMITHHRPVYAALYFVLVVLSSAAIFLYLEAEFMAFALIIVYAGAILITYLFVLMLAQQAPTSDELEDTTPAYDRLPREPLAGVFVGFLLIALLGQLIFSASQTLPAQPTDEALLAERTALLNNLDKRRSHIVSAFQRADASLPMNSRIASISDEGVTFVVPPGERREFLTYEQAGIAPDEVGRLVPDNIEEVGWALVHTFPVSLELAGIILLMAMFGAVVLARKQIELGEDEKRLAAGLQRLTVDHSDEGGGS